MTWSDWLAGRGADEGSVEEPSGAVECRPGVIENMRRGLVLGTLIGVAALSLVVSGQGQGPSAQAIEATKIEKVKDNLYIITGSSAETIDAFSGGNMAVFITDAGVTLVDTKLPDGARRSSSGSRR